MPGSQGSRPWGGGAGVGGVQAPVEDGGDVGGGVDLPLAQGGGERGGSGCWPSAAIRARWPRRVGQAGESRMPGASSSAWASIALILVGAEQVGGGGVQAVAGTGRWPG